MKKSAKRHQSKKQTEKKYIVKGESELLPFLLEQKIKSSRNATKSILSRGQVKVDGKTITQHNAVLKPGQEIEIIENKEMQRKSELMGIRILYEDQDLIVIDKEAGILSVAAKHPNEWTAHYQLSLYVKDKNPRNRVFVVHRLDRDTSGVMMFAKNEKAKRILQDNWKKMVTERIYTAMVEGEPAKKEDTIDSWLSENKAFKVYSSPKDNGGKRAVTHYHVAQTNGNYSLLTLTLETGRKNQIRVHLSDIGHPIVGDKKYGAQTNPLKRLGLHATTIKFKHPTSGKLMQFHSAVPKIFKLKTKTSV
ncbi:RluA family pseudouridine synthase [Pisciglobus halotolerans]|uniref:Pseudouridine synthase n=1 Tax=Pisciglobus halotolerans TaxID=745365 RepID=A0A1I3C5R5_9LACT|nr:RluA family pseudouridine synthase [Pisciglobus halotolerans]SFH69918.1 23S rRNA pseudouridine1911/1915/1917 synthase [Pisciglobus halotolerans]